ncbi:MAG: pilus assembly protein PilM [Candidatus Omnitrophota bacterium]
MKKEEKKPHKNIVEEIFASSQSEAKKISTIFTYFKHPPKVMLPSQPLAKSSFKNLPAGIDIGTDSVRLLQLAEGNKNEPVIILADEEKYALSPAADTINFQKNALQKIIQRNNLKGECVIGLSVSDVQIYNMTFPNMPESEFKNALQYKLSQMRPFGLSLEEINFGFLRWDVVSQTAQMPQSIRLFVVCVPSKTIEQKVHLLENAGLDVFSVEVNAVSLVNLNKFFKFPSKSEEVSLWLDLGVEQSSLIIEKGGVALFLRPLSFSFNRLTKAIAKSLNIGEEEAEQIRDAYGISFWTPEQKSDGFEGKDASVYRAIISQLENLAIDIEHSFKYFSYQVSQYQIAKFDKIFLTGPTAALKKLDSFLSFKLKVPARILNPFDLFSQAQTLVKQKSSMETAAAFAIAAGLSATSKIEEAQRINLLSITEKKAYKVFTVAVKNKIVRLVAAVVAIVSLVTGFQIMKLNLAKSQVTDLDERVKKAKIELDYRNLEQVSLAKEEAIILDKKAFLEGRFNLMKESMREPGDFSSMLWAAGLLLPEDIWVTKLSYKERRLQITGSTPDINSVMQLVETLKSKDEFSNASFLYSKKEAETGIYDFEIGVEIKK